MCTIERRITGVLNINLHIKKELASFGSCKMKTWMELCWYLFPYENEFCFLYHFKWILKLKYLTLKYLFLTVLDCPLLICTWCEAIHLFPLHAGKTTLALSGKTLFIYRGWWRARCLSCANEYYVFVLISTAWNNLSVIGRCIVAYTLPTISPKH